jgi:hypothetical protein
MTSRFQFSPEVQNAFQSVLSISEGFEDNQTTAFLEPENQNKLLGLFTQLAARINEFNDITSKTNQAEEDLYELMVALCFGGNEVKMIEVYENNLILGFFLVAQIAMGLNKTQTYLNKLGFSIIRNRQSTLSIRDFKISW